MVKQLVLLASISFTVVLTIINFINLESIPEVGLGFEDKLYHVGVYMVFSFLWVLWARIQFMNKRFWIFGLLCLLYGILLEITQQVVNPSRTFDVLDLLSNCIGVILGTVIVAIVIQQKVKLN